MRPQLPRCREGVVAGGLGFRLGSPCNSCIRLGEIYSSFGRVFRFADLLVKGAAPDKR